MTHLLSEDCHSTKQLQEENLPDYKLLISQMDSDNRESNPSFEPYHSSSPCSSESADSYPSSNSQSPAEKMTWLCLQSSPCRISEQEPNDCAQIRTSCMEQLQTQSTDRILSPLDSLDYPSDCDSSFLFTDYIDQDLFATQTSFDSVPSDLNSDRMTDSLKNQIVCAFQDPDCLALEDPSYDSVRLPTRPKTLSLNETGRIQGQQGQRHHHQHQHQGHSEMFCLLTSPNTPNELQQQLASADIAWMDALDVPNLSLEEIERILSTVNSLRSPEEETTTIPNESSKTEDKCPLPSTRQVETSCDPEIRSPRKEDGCDLMEISTTDDRMSSNDDQMDDSGKADKLATQLDGFDSDSTLTCSEAEYYNNKIRHRKVRRTKRSYQRTSADESSDLSSCSSESEDDLCWVENAQGRDETGPKCKNVGWYTRVTGSQSMSRYPSYRRVRNVQADTDMEPWWPRSCPRRVSNNIGASTPGSKRTVKNQKTVHKSRGDQLVTDPEQTSSDEETSDGESIVNPDLVGEKNSSRPLRTTSQTGHKFQPKRKPRTRQNLSSRTAAHLMWRGQRRQKQMELWQFILCRLETGKQSAFQWVNRSNGVFRIVDTQAGAKEWGSYRNNKRMDYEKMARAMRFYYKDSILRKARQQLHFQFAMSYVEWAAKYYESIP